MYSKKRKLQIRIYKIKKKNVIKKYGDEWVKKKTIRKINDNSYLNRLGEGRSFRFFFVLFLAICAGGLRGR